MLKGLLRPYNCDKPITYVFHLNARYWKGQKIMPVSRPSDYVTPFAPAALLVGPRYDYVLNNNMRGYYYVVVRTALIWPSAVRKYIMRFRENAEDTRVILRPNIKLQRATQHFFKRV